MTTNLEQVQTFKILIIGDSSVGKSSLMTRFVHGVFNTQYIATIGVDFQIATVDSGDFRCRLQIWFVYTNTLRLK
jgi:GTPase SAR1 family protein